MRQAQVNLAIRWFAGYRLHEQLPDHSSLTTIRRRWGAARFGQIFQRTVRQCVAAGLVDAKTIHVDATLIRADVSWASLAEQHVEKVLEANPPGAEGDDPGAPRGRRATGKAKRPKKRSRTDPDATLTTNAKGVRMEPRYKQHTAVDDKAGVIVDVEVTTGEANEGKQLLRQIGRVEQTTGRKVKQVTADGAYADSRNYMALENRDIDAVIPPQGAARKPKRIPARRFKYDGRHKIVRCPRGKVLRRSHRQRNGWAYRARARVCGRCPLRSRCVSPSGKARSIVIADGQEALVRARRRKLRGWDASTAALYSRHRSVVEGRHGEAKRWHGLARASRRRLWNVSIQAYLTAAVMNLKRLAALAELPAAAVARLRGAARGASATAASLLSLLRTGLWPRWPQTAPARPARPVHVGWHFPPRRAHRTA
jgi:hypothetical protein